MTWSQETCHILNEVLFPGEGKFLFLLKESVSLIEESDSFLVCTLWSDIMRVVRISRIRILNLILALVIMADFFCVPVSAKESDDIARIQKVVEKTIENIGISDAIIQNAGSTDSDWLVFAVSRYADVYGIREYKHEFERYSEALKTYVAAKYKSGSKLNRNKSTEWHRISLAALACGDDPSSLAGVNLIADGTYNCVIGAPWKQGINGAAMALITLDAKDYKVPENAEYSRNDIIDYILSKELPSGGFALSGDTPDVDVTAMCVQALAKYNNSRNDVHKVVEKSIDCLASQQLKDATYGNAESTAQVIVALTCMGIYPTKDSRFITKNGLTLLDGLLSYYIDDDSMFCHVNDGEANLMATTQCLYSLVSVLRNNNGMGSLYDFSQMTIQIPTKAPQTTKPKPSERPKLTTAPKHTSNPTATMKPQETIDSTPTTPTSQTWQGEDKPQATHKNNDRQKVAKATKAPKSTQKPSKNTVKKKKNNKKESETAKENNIIENTTPDTLAETTSVTTSAITSAGENDDRVLNSEAEEKKSETGFIITSGLVLSGLLGIIVIRRWRKRNAKSL